MYTQTIQNFIQNCKLTEIGIGCSDTQVFKIEKQDNDVYFLKIGKLNSLNKEHKLLVWLNGKLPVPECIIFDSDNLHDYMITKSVKGEMSCSKNNLDNPENTIKLLAKAITQIQNVNIKDCPFDNSINNKLKIAEYNVENDLLKDEMKSKIGKSFKTYKQLLNYLKQNKPKEELVLSHGDTSLPNIFFDNNKVSGFIDVGECGIADKWFDISITCKSIKRNFKNADYLIDLFLKEMGLAKSDSIEYYEALMDLYL